MVVKVYNFTSRDIRCEVEVTYSCECLPQGEFEPQLEKITIRVFEGEKQ